jgi:Na+/H+-dicarboxylate symporter
MGLRTFTFYVVTTAMAISLALVLAIIINPGEGVDLAKTVSVELAPPPSIYQMLLDIFPKNIVAAMAQGNMLQIIVFAILVGLGLLHAQEPGRRLLAVCEDANALMLRLVVMIMNLAPFAVFCLVTHVFAVKGIEILIPLIVYVSTVIAALLLHATLTYGTLFAVFVRANPVRFIKKLYPALLFAFSTASSAATMPITLRLVEKVLGVRNSVASFTVPMGATLNMDGTAIMQGVATAFIAGAYGVDLVFADYLMVILTATLASIGTAAVPSAGLVTLSIVLLQVGLPAEAIGLIIGVDRLLDMIRTAVNVLGDATVTTIVAHQEKLWQREVFEEDHLLTED